METTWIELAKYFLTPILGLVGAYFGYLWARKKERDAKRRDLKINYLIEAYRHLEGCSIRKPSEDIDRKMESCIADIQLFGTLKQIKEAQKIGQQLSETNECNPHDLLVELRKDLRKELGLDYSGSIKHLRFESRQRK